MIPETDALRVAALALCRSLRQYPNSSGGWEPWNEEHRDLEVLLDDDLGHMFDCYKEKT